MKNKLLAGALALVLSAGLTGCGSDEPPPPRAISPDPEHTTSDEMETRPPSSSVNEQYNSGSSGGSSEPAVLPGAENIPKDVRQGGDTAQ